MQTAITKGSDTVTTTYIDGLFEQVYDSATGNLTYRHYILAGGARVGVETISANSGGTITADTLSFDVRDEVGSVIATVTKNLGGANQLSLSDPSGYFSLGGLLSTGDPMAGFFPQQYGEVLSVVGPIVGAALNAVPGCQGWCDYVVTMASEAEAGYLETGSVGVGLRSGLLAGAEAYTFSFVGGLGWDGSAGDLVAKSFAEGLVGGAFSSAGGGRFSDGFLGAFVGSESSGLIGQIGGNPNEAEYFSANNESMRVVLSMLAGGTASRLAGGNFTEGALAAAFQRIFNDDRHARLNRERLENVDRIVAARAQNAIDMLQAEYGMDVVVEKDAYRTFAEEDLKFSEGNSEVRGGYSWHNYGLAVDVVEIINGKPDWGYTNIGALRAAMGSEGFKYYSSGYDPGHFWMPLGHTISELLLEHTEAEQIKYPPWY